MSAEEIWIVHLCVKIMQPKEKSHYPSKEEESEKINVIHFSHGREFEKVQMCSRYKNIISGTIEIIDNEEN
jgi:hypothetical protein